MTARAKNTERQNTAGTIKRRKDPLQHLKKTIPHPFIVFNPDRSVRYANPAFSRLAGYSNISLAGQFPPYSFWPEFRRTQYVQELNDPRKSRFEWQLYQKNGGLIWVSVVVSPYIERGQTRYYLGIITDTSEQKMTEEALRISEARFNKLFEVMPIPMALLSMPENKFVNVNARFLHFGGYKREEVVGLKASDFNIFATPTDAFKLADAISKDGSVTDLELDLVSKNGQQHTSLFSIVPIKLGDEEYTISASVDITDRKKMENALRESEAFNAGLLENSPNPVVVVNPDSSVRYINPALEKLTGFSRDEVIGTKFPYPWWTPEHLEEAKKLGNINPQRNLDSHEVRFCKKNGEYFWVNVSFRHVKDGEQTRYLLGNWVDITERKKAEEALKESEAFNSSLLDNAPNPILVVNPDSSIRYANPALLKLTGFNRDEIIGKKFPYPWWTPEFIAEARKAGRLDTPQNVEDEVRFRKKNGEYFWVSASVRNVKNNESTWYLLGNWTDITESKQMEERIVDLYNTEKNQREELQEEARARGLFINVLAHELRTPVTPILASTGMLNDLLKDQPESIQKRLASNIFNSTQTLARRLEELLDLARYSRGTFKLQMQPADINKLIQNIVSQFQPTIDQRRQRLIIDLESEFPRAEIDPSRLEQVIINLLSNASKFSPEQGTIYLHARIENSNLRMDIRDEGIGIPSEEQGRLFQPYHRVEQDRQQFPGLGLGLAISKQIVEAHGGSIRVTSTPGQGSTFSFTIPLSKGC